MTDELTKLQTALSLSLDKAHKNVDAVSELPRAFHVLSKQHAASASDVCLKHSKDHIEVSGNFSSHVLEGLDRQEHAVTSALDRTKEAVDGKNLAVCSMKDTITATIVEALGEFIAEVDSSFDSIAEELS